MKKNTKKELNNFFRGGGWGNLTPQKERDDCIKYLTFDKRV